MSNLRNFKQNKPSSLFVPSVVRSINENHATSAGFEKINFEILASSSMEDSGSHRYGIPGDGLKSTQQLNIDWSQFENHTFFNSAFVKTNVAFKKVFDQFPFDGTQKEFELFIDQLTGFEKYVYDQFPKNIGYLYFSGTVPGEVGSNGTFVTIKDAAGATFPGVSKNISGKTILNPGISPLTLEFHTYLPAQSNSGSFVLHKFVTSSSFGTHGYGVVCEPTGSSVSGSLTFVVSSGSYVLSSSVVIPKGEWNHVSFNWDRRASGNQVFSYLNGDLVTSSSQIEMGLLNMDSADLVIGSGSAINVFTPLNTFSGSLDELRIWNSTRTKEERMEFKEKNVFSQEPLKLYLKFNEASGSLSNIVLDHSGNSLHGIISTWANNNNIRNISTGSTSGPSPMTYEKVENNPILFPLHPANITLNEEFLENAREFDEVNPNRIDRLIPKHYLLDGQEFDGLSSEEGTIVDAIGTSNSSGTPDSAKLGSSQVILSMLYTWAKFFDEIKLYVQSFSSLMHLDYDNVDTVPDAFLQLFADQYGIKLPALFSGANINQFINGENIDNDIGTNSYSLQYIQNQIWRRILLNLQDVLKSKGTVHSVKSFIRSVGIEPDNNFRIREFGGPTSKFLSNARETRSQVSTLLDLSETGRITSPFLSGSRLQAEAGFPKPATSTYSNGISTNPNDGLLTSGSWTYEAIYRYPSTSSLSSITQSLVRIMSTGSAAPNSGSFLIGNLIATTDGMLKLAISPNYLSDSTFTLELDADVFDGKPWNISFGRTRADEINSKVSSSYFLRAAQQEYGEIKKIYTTSSYINETIGGTSTIIWSNISGTIGPANASGSYLTIGPNISSVIPTGSAFLNSGSVDSFYRSHNFDGRVGHVRFWSKTLDLTEWKEHVKNFTSLGVSDPKNNFNFVTNTTGSFGRLRMDVSTDQDETLSDNSGNLQIIDFSQNGYHWSGSAFPITSSVVVPQRFQYSLISPKFDIGSTTDKIRVRSYQSYENTLSSSYARVAPLYSIEPSEKPEDDTRFTIDFSIADALDQDIIKIFSTLDILDNVLGDPELLFSPDYPSLENLRDIYFHRLSGEVNLKSFFEFYKWFDSNIGNFIIQLLPSQTRFLGSNFLIESHCLERAKIEYYSSDIYVGDSSRSSLRDTIIFRQIAGTVGR